MPKQKFQFQNTKIQPAALKDAPEDTALVPMIDKLNTPKNTIMEIKIIPRRKIRSNRKNKYPLIELESLKESILYYGLQQPITTIYLENEDMYCIEGGHRRTAALDSLLKDFVENDYCENEERTRMYLKNVRQYEKGYPCIIKDTWEGDSEYDAPDNVENLSALPDEIIDSEIRLIITNTEIRTDDPVIRAANISRLSQLYDRKNFQNQNTKKININKQIGKDLGITERQVAKYKSLDNLLPELQTAFADKELSLNTCTVLARQPEENQRNIIDSVQTVNNPQLDSEIMQLLAKQESHPISAPTNTDIISENERLFSTHMGKLLSSLSCCIELVDNLSPNFIMQQKANVEKLNTLYLRLKSKN